MKKYPILEGGHKVKKCSPEATTKEKKKETRVADGTKILKGRTTKSLLVVHKRRASEKRVGGTRKIYKTDVQKKRR